MHKPLVFLTSITFLLLGGCSVTTPNNAPSGYQLSTDENEALGGGIVQHFAENLPNYAYEAELRLRASATATQSYIVKSINSHGNVVKIENMGNAIKILGNVGSGSMNMNPAGLVIIIMSDGGETTISIRAVAKEGKVKQNTCGKAVDRLIAELESLSGQNAISKKKL